MILYYNFTNTSRGVRKDSNLTNGDKMKLLIILISLITLNTYASEKKVLMFVSNGFYAPEYYTPRAILEKEGHHITVAAMYDGLTSPDRRNTNFAPVRADITFDQINVEDYDAFVFAGGNGAWEDFFPNETIHKILEEALNSNKVVALLCSSTGLLGVAGNLSGTEKPIAEGRKVTGYKRVKGLLTVLGKVDYSSGIEGQPYVVVDQNLITGRDPISSELFGETVAKTLK